jgi:hypothetical protein
LRDSRLLQWDNHWLGNRRGSLSFLVRTISNVLVMEIGWTDVGSGGYILVSCAHSKTNKIIVDKSNLCSKFLFHQNLSQCFFYFICSIYWDPRYITQFCQGLSWPWSYGGWIYNYLWNQWLSPLMLCVRLPLRARCTTLCDKVYQWLGTVHWFSPDPLPIKLTAMI